MLISAVTYLISRFLIADGRLYSFFSTSSALGTTVNHARLQEGIRSHSGQLTRQTADPLRWLLPSWGRMEHGWVLPQGHYSAKTLMPTITFLLVNTPGKGPEPLLCLGSEERTLIMAHCTPGESTWQHGELHYGRPKMRA